MDRNEEEVFEQDQFENCRYQWTKEMTKLLIEEIRKFISVLQKKNNMQKKIWKDIASNIRKKGYDVTDEQCSVKWKNLKQKYRTVRDANNKTGSAKITWEYFDIIDEFMNSAPEITPLSLASNTRGFRLQKESEISDLNTTCASTSFSTSSSTASHNTRNIRKRARQDNNELVYYENFYKQRERHHKENIEMQNKFLTLLKDIYKNNQQ